MRHRLLDATLTVALAIVAVLMGLNLSAINAPVQAAPPELENCEKAASAEGQSLYLCDVFGLECIWDPSPNLGAGVMSCEW